MMAVEGTVIAVVGMYILNQPEVATRALLVALGALLLFHGVPRLSRFYHGAAEARIAADQMLGWYNTAVGGAAVLLSLIVSNENLTVVAVLLGVVLAISGVLDLLERLRIDKAQRRPGFLIMPLILIAAGVALVVVRGIPSLNVEVVGQVLALLGLALLAIGLLRVYGNSKARATLKEAEAKQAALARDIAAAEAKVGTQPQNVPPPPPPAPAPVAAPPPVAPASSAGPDEPEDPAVKAALKP